LNHPHGFAADADVKAARKEITTRAKSLLGDDYKRVTSGSDDRSFMVKDVWSQPVEMFSLYESCSGVKVCPYYQSDYDAEAENAENEENEDEIHSKRVAALTKQAEIEGLLPYSKTIAYVFLFFSAILSNSKLS
jgi:hypothetical protein